MRHGAKNYRKAYGSGARVSKIPNRVCITERPAIVEEKSRIGDWECDTVIGLDPKITGSHLVVCFTTNSRGHPLEFSGQVDIRVPSSFIFIKPS